MLYVLSSWPSVLSVWEWPPSSYFVRLQYTVCVNAFNAAVKYFVKAQSSLINCNYWRQGMIRFLFHLYIWSNHDGEHNLMPLHFLFSHNCHLVRWASLKECDWPKSPGQFSCLSDLELTVSRPAFSTPH